MPIIISPNVFHVFQSSSSDVGSVAGQEIQSLEEFYEEHRKVHPDKDHRLNESIPIRVALEKCVRLLYWNSGFSHPQASLDVILKVTMERFSDLNSKPEIQKHVLNHLIEVASYTRSSRAIDVSVRQFFMDIAFCSVGLQIRTIELYDALLGVKSAPLAQVELFFRKRLLAKLDEAIIKVNRSERVPLLNEQQTVHVRATSIEIAKRKNLISKEGIKVSDRFVTEDKLLRIEQLLEPIFQELIKEILTQVSIQEILEMLSQILLEQIDDVLGVAQCGTTKEISPEKHKQAMEVVHSVLKTFAEKDECQGVFSTEDYLTYQISRAAIYKLLIPFFLSQGIFNYPELPKGESAAHRGMQISTVDNQPLMLHCDLTIANYEHNQLDIFASDGGNFFLSDYLSKNPEYADVVIDHLIQQLSASFNKQEIFIRLEQFFNRAVDPGQHHAALDAWRRTELYQTIYDGVVAPYLPTLLVQIQSALGDVSHLEIGKLIEKLMSLDIVELIRRSSPPSMQAGGLELIGLVEAIKKDLITESMSRLLALKPKQELVDYVSAHPNTSKTDLVIKYLLAKRLPELVRADIAWLLTSTEDSRAIMSLGKQILSLLYPGLDGTPAKIEFVEFINKLQLSAVEIVALLKLDTTMVAQSEFQKWKKDPNLFITFLNLLIDKAPFFEALTYNDLFFFLTHEKTRDSFARQLPYLSKEKCTTFIHKLSWEQLGKTHLVKGFPELVKAKLRHEINHIAQMNFSGESDPQTAFLLELSKFETNRSISQLLREVFHEDLSLFIKVVTQEKDVTKVINLLNLYPEFYYVRCFRINKDGTSYLTVHEYLIKQQTPTDTIFKQMLAAVDRFKQERRLGMLDQGNKIESILREAKFGDTSDEVRIAHQWLKMSTPESQSPMDDTYCFDPLTLSRPEKPFPLLQSELIAALESIKGNVSQVVLSGVENKSDQQELFDRLTLLIQHAASAGEERQLEDFIGVFLNNQMIAHRQFRSLHFRLQHLMTQVGKAFSDAKLSRAQRHALPSSTSNLSAEVDPEVINFIEQIQQSLINSKTILTKFSFSEDRHKFGNERLKAQLIDNIARFQESLKSTRTLQELQNKVKEFCLLNDGMRIIESGLASFRRTMHSKLSKIPINGPHPNAVEVSVPASLIEREGVRIQLNCAEGAYPPFMDACVRTKQILEECATVLIQAGLPMAEFLADLKGILFETKLDVFIGNQENGYRLEEIFASSFIKTKGQIEIGKIPKFFNAIPEEALIKLFNRVHQKIDDLRFYYQCLNYVLKNAPFPAIPQTEQGLVNIMSARSHLTSYQNESIILTLAKMNFSDLPMVQKERANSLFYNLMHRYHEVSGRQRFTDESTVKKLEFFLLDSVLHIQDREALLRKVLSSINEDPVRQVLSEVYQPSVWAFALRELIGRGNLETISLVQEILNKTQGIIEPCSLQIGVTETVPFPLISIADVAGSSRAVSPAHSALYQSIIMQLSSLTQIHDRIYPAQQELANATYILCSLESDDPKLETKLFRVHQSIVSSAFIVRSSAQELLLQLSKKLSLPGQLNGEDKNTLADSFNLILNSLDFLARIPSSKIKSSELEVQNQLLNQISMFLNVLYDSRETKLFKQMVTILLSHPSINGINLFLINFMWKENRQKFKSLRELLSDMAEEENLLDTSIRKNAATEPGEVSWTQLDSLLENNIKAHTKYRSFEQILSCIGLGFNAVTLSKLLSEHLKNSSSYDDFSRNLLQQTIRLSLKLKKHKRVNESELSLIANEMTNQVMGTLLITAIMQRNESTVQKILSEATGTEFNPLEALHYDSNNQAMMNPIDLAMDTNNQQILSDIMDFLFKGELIKPTPEFLLNLFKISSNATPKQDRVKFNQISLFMVNMSCKPLTPDFKLTLEQWVEQQCTAAEPQAVSLEIRENEEIIEVTNDSLKKKAMQVLSIALGSAVRAYDKQSGLGIENEQQRIIFENICYFENLLTKIDETSRFIVLVKKGTANTPQKTYIDFLTQIPVWNNHFKSMLRSELDQINIKLNEFLDLKFKPSLTDVQEINCLLHNCFLILTRYSPKPYEQFNAYFSTIAKLLAKYPSNERALQPWLLKAIEENNIELVHVLTQIGVNPQKALIPKIFDFEKEFPSRVFRNKPKNLAELAVARGNMKVINIIAQLPWVSPINYQRLEHPEVRQKILSDHRPLFGRVAGLRVLSWNVQGGGHSGIHYDDEDIQETRRLEHERRANQMTELEKALPHVDVILIQEGDVLFQDILRQNESWKEEFELIYSIVPSAIDTGLFQNSDPTRIAKLFPSRTESTLHVRPPNIPLRLLAKDLNPDLLQLISDRVKRQQNIVVTWADGNHQVVRVHFVDKKGNYCTTDLDTDWARELLNGYDAQGKITSGQQVTLYRHLLSQCSASIRTPSDTKQAEPRKGMMVLARKMKGIYHDMFTNLSDGWINENIRECSQGCGIYNSQRSALQVAYVGAAPGSSASQKKPIYHVVMNMHAYRPDGDGGIGLKKARDAFQEFCSKIYPDKQFIFTFMGDINTAKNHPDLAYRTSSLIDPQPWYGDKLKTGSHAAGFNVRTDKLISTVPAVVGVSLTGLCAPGLSAQQLESFNTEESDAICGGEHAPDIWIRAVQQRLGISNEARVIMPSILESRGVISLSDKPIWYALAAVDEASSLMKEATQRVSLSEESKAVGSSSSASLQSTSAASLSTFFKKMITEETDYSIEIVPISFHTPSILVWSAANNWPIPDSWNSLVPREKLADKSLEPIILCLDGINILLQMPSTLLHEFKLHAPKLGSSHSEETVNKIITVKGIKTIIGMRAWLCSGGELGDGSKNKVYLLDPAKFPDPCHATVEGLKHYCDVVYEPKTTKTELSARSSS